MPRPRTTSFRYRTTLLGGLTALLWLVASAGVAAAAGISLLGGITDPGDVLGACRSKVLAAESSLYDRTGSNLFVVLVPDTGATDLSSFVDATWSANPQLTPKDILFVGTTAPVHAQLLQGTTVDGSVTQNEQDAITESLRTPALAGDWCAATLAVASGYETAIAGAPAPAPAPAPTPDSSGTAGGGVPDWLIGLIILAVVGAIGFWFLRGRANRAVFQERAAQEDLGKQASALLIATDDAVRAADQEVGFAQAQFGDAQAVPLQKALDDAKAELRQAFLISQQLDDDKPETPDQRHTMLQEIIDRCTKAQGLVNDQMARIKTLRDLAKNVDQVLPQTVTAVDTQIARIEPAKTVLGTLASRFAAQNIAAVVGDPDAAGVKLTAAKASLAAASTALAAKDRDTAVKQVQAAETALTEATAQLDAVDATQAALDQGETQLAASIAAVQQDVTQARAALSAGTGTERAADVDRAAALLGQAQQLASVTPLDVVGATRAVTEANTLIDSVLAGVQASEAAVQRNAAAAQAAYANAVASVAQASALVAADSGSAAGRQARTRVAQAQQYLVKAQSLMATDPATAAQASQTADALADEAIADMQAARGVPGTTLGGVPGNSWGGRPTTTHGSGGGGYTQPSGGGGGLESFLGGFLGGMLSGGGGGRNSGWSGGSGGFGGFGSGGFGGSSGGFGGGGGGRSSMGSGGGGAGRRSGF